MKKILFIFAILFACSFDCPAKDKSFTLRILFINDIHEHLLSERETGIGGLAKVCHLVKKMKKEDKNTIFLIGGDILSGTFFSNFFKGSAIIDALNACDPDAMVIGNHEFDNGIERLIELKAKAGFSMISGNVFIKGKNTPLFKDQVVLNKSNKKILIEGLTTPEAIRSNDIEVKSPFKQQFPKNEKADVIILLSHLGVSKDKKIAKKHGEINVIIGGHSHTVIQECEIINQIPVCQAGDYTGYLGEVLLEISDKQVSYKYSHLIKIDKDVPEDKKVKEIINKYYVKIEKEMNEKIAHSTIFFNGSAHDLYRMESNLGDLITDVMKEHYGADVAILNSGGIRSNLNKGDITMGDVYSVLPFDNRLVILDVKGSKLKEVLQYSLSRRGQSGFIQLSGVRFIMENGSFLELFVGKSPLDDNKIYKIVTIDYLLTKKGKFKDLGIFITKETDDFLRDIFIDYLKKKKELEEPESGRMNFR
jgi:5'-nucleotidase